MWVLDLLGYLLRDQVGSVVGYPLGYLLGGLPPSPPASPLGYLFHYLTYCPVGYLVGCRLGYLIGCRVDCLLLNLVDTILGLPRPQPSKNQFVNFSYLLLHYKPVRETAV